MMMLASVIHINAFPGVGKLTIASALQLLLPSLRILHNQEIIDPVEENVLRTSPCYAAALAEDRRARLKPIHQDQKLRDTIFVFTDSQMGYNECVSDYTDLCLSFSGGNGGHAVGRRFYSVILECEEEKRRRLVLTGRSKEAGNGKLKYVDILREYHSQVACIGLRIVMRLCLMLRVWRRMMRQGESRSSWRGGRGKGGVRMTWSCDMGHVCLRFEMS
jgi:hypothetical protein